MNKIINNKNFIVLILVISLLVIYSINEAGKRNNKIRLETLKDSKMSSIEVDYGTCKNLAYKDYSDNWDLQCNAQGKVANCLLSGTTLKSVEDIYAKAKDTCLDIYKAKLNTVK